MSYYTNKKSCYYKYAQAVGYNSGGGSNESLKKLLEENP